MKIILAQISLLVILTGIGFSNTRIPKGLYISSMVVYNIMAENTEVLDLNFSNPLRNIATDKNDTTMVCHNSLLDWPVAASVHCI